jgi:hypothetical protein
MYPDRQSVERLEEDFGQDQAQLAARGLLDNQHLAGEEPEPRHHRHSDEETLEDSDVEEPD